MAWSACEIRQLAQHLHARQPLGQEWRPGSGFPRASAKQADTAGSGSHVAG